MLFKLHKENEIETNEKYFFNWPNGLWKNNNW